jgi:hypothetical protein
LEYVVALEAASEAADYLEAKREKRVNPKRAAAMDLAITPEEAAELADEGIRFIPLTEDQMGSEWTDGDDLLLFSECMEEILDFPVVTRQSPVSEYFLNQVLERLDLDHKIEEAWMEAWECYHDRIYASTRRASLKRPRRSKRGRRTAAMEWPSTRLVNYPTPDTTHPTFTEDGIWVDDKTPLQKAFPKTRDYPEELERKADAFWEDYQMFKIRKIPGVSFSNENLSAYKYAIMWQSKEGMETEEMRELMDYMVKIGLFPQSVYDSWDQFLSYDPYMSRTQDDTA